MLRKSKRLWIKRLSRNDRSTGVDHRLSKALLRRSGCRRCCVPRPVVAIANGDTCSNRVYQITCTFPLSRELDLVIKWAATMNNYRIIYLLIIALIGWSSCAPVRTAGGSSSHDNARYSAVISLEKRSAAPRTAHLLRPTERSLSAIPRAFPGYNGHDGRLGIQWSRSGVLYDRSGVY